MEIKNILFEIKNILSEIKNILFEIPETKSKKINTTKTTKTRSAKSGRIWPKTLMFYSPNGRPRKNRPNHSTGARSSKNGIRPKSRSAGFQNWIFGVSSQAGYDRKIHFWPSFCPKPAKTTKTRSVKSDRIWPKQALSIQYVSPLQQALSIHNVSP